MLNPNGGFVFKIEKAAEQGWLLFMLPHGFVPSFAEWLNVFTAEITHVYMVIHTHVIQHPFLNRF